MAQLSAEPAIEELYKEWNKINREKLSIYYENKDPSVPLADNKEFRSIKNMIIKAVLDMPTDFVPALSVEVYEKQRDTVEPVSPQTYEETAESEPPKTADFPESVTRHEEPIPLNTIATAKEIIGALARLIGEKCMAHRQGLQGQIDQKLQGKINEKKRAMGLKTEVTQKPNYQTEETYEMSM